LKQIPDDIAKTLDALDELANAPTPMTGIPRMAPPPNLDCGDHRDPWKKLATWVKVQ
jgi:hypothetical protein